MLAGDLPRAEEAVELSAKWLGDVQFHACNASGICDGVDAGLLPRVATFPLGTDAEFSKSVLRCESPHVMNGGLFEFG